MATGDQFALSCLIHDPEIGYWLLFRQPDRVVSASSLNEVVPALEAVQAEVRERKMYAAGFLAYEAGPAFDPAITGRSTGNFPLAWFGIYSALEKTRELPNLMNPGPNLSWKPDTSPEDYYRSIRKIKRYIANGDTYQVNYTIRLHTRLESSPWDLFLATIQAQGSHYGAYIHTGDWSICSASPELFFNLDGNVLTSRPMKGTSRRGLWPGDDQSRSRQLKHSAKNQAENVMIVDMVRNDLGRIALIGSVQVPSLFDVERYPTLWQMTSTVQAQTHQTLPEIFRALFPPASITGAPKIRTTQIIAELENSPRRIYTGSIGYCSPEGRAQFNVAIRTVLVDNQTQLAEYGVGGGIVWDSTWQGEYEEWQVKARILTHQQPDFELIESLRWTPEEGYVWLEQHLSRLIASSDYFGWQLDRQDLRRGLQDYACSLPRAPHKVRLLVTRTGRLSIEAHELHPLPDPYTIRLASAPIDTQDRFLYHKTTQRLVYDKALAEAPGCSDALLWNERGEITESTIANVVIELNGRLVTPPIRCGLLPGIYRDRLLKKGQVAEMIIPVDLLSRSTAIFLVNSVRGMWRATLTNDAPGSYRSLAPGGYPSIDRK